MAKSKKEQSENVELSNYSFAASDLSDNVGRVFPTTISLDIALSGGIPEGSSVLLSGVAKSGKTSLALHYVAKCQLSDPTKKVFFFDVEGRLRPELLRCIKGLNLANLQVVRSNEKKILSAEDYLNLVMEALKEHPKCIVILDSVAALCPEGELSSKIGDSKQMAGIATLMYTVFRRVSQVIPVTQSTFIGINHMIANPGKGKSSFESGGNAQRYQASVWLQAKWVEAIDKGDKKIGQIAHFVVMASALGAPGSKVKVPIIFGHGVDEVTDVFRVAVDLGLIEKGGAWYTIPNHPEKVQGEEKCVALIRSDEKIYNHLYNAIRDMTGLESIDGKPESLAHAS
jgi:recombination protein RecA